MVSVKQVIFAVFALAGQSIADNNAVFDKYIVTLRDGVSERSFDKHMKWVKDVQSRVPSRRRGSGVEKKYNTDFGYNGYVGSFDEATLAEIRASPEVQAVEKDAPVYLSVMTEDDPRLQQRARNLGRSEDVEQKNAPWGLATDVEQKNAPWGLATVSHRSPFALEYNYNEAAGRETYAYVIDTGVRQTHNEFDGGRVHQAYTAFDSHEDTFGHGTHVAGTIAERPLGGFNWAVTDILKKNRTSKAVISMSYGGLTSEAVNTAVDRASAHGVVSVAAAGNFADGSSLQSPASAKSAICVGAIDEAWIMANFSNFGPNNDIFAPGVEVLSAWNESDGASKLLSGTSMSTPHVSGLVLYAMSVYGISGVEPVTQHLIKTATRNKIRSGVRGSPNLIGNNNVPGQWQ